MKAVEFERISAAFAFVDRAHNPAGRDRKFKHYGGAGDRRAGGEVVFHHA